MKVTITMQEGGPPTRCRGTGRIGARRCDGCPDCHLVAATRRVYPAMAMLVPAISGACRAKSKLEDAINRRAATVPVDRDEVRRLATQWAEALPCTVLDVLNDDRIWTAHFRLHGVPER